MCIEQVSYTTQAIRDGGSYFLKVTHYLLLLPKTKIFRYSYILPRNQSNCNNITYYITFENNSAIL